MFVELPVSNALEILHQVLAHLAIGPPILTVFNALPDTSLKDRHVQVAHRNTIPSANNAHYHNVFPVFLLYKCL